MWSFIYYQFSTLDRKNERRKKEISLNFKEMGKVRRVEVMQEDRIISHVLKGDADRTVEATSVKQ